MKTLPRYLIILFALFCSCGRSSGRVSREMQQFAAQNAEDLKHSGPAAWINYFDRSNFQMSVNGQTVYGSFAEAGKGIEILTAHFSKVILTWSNPAIKEIGPDYAEFNAGYTEELQMKSDSTDHFFGTFSGLARHTPSGWKWRSIRWTVQTK